MTRLTDRDLDGLLSNWREEAGEDPFLAEKVWRRIAVCGNEAGVSAVSQWRRRLEWAALRPAFAAVMIGAFVLGGLAAAEWRAQQERVETTRTLEAQYFRAIDPVSMARHYPGP